MLSVAIFIGILRVKIYMLLLPSFITDNNLEYY